MGRRLERLPVWVEKINEKGPAAPSATAAHLSFSWEETSDRSGGTSQQLMTVGW